MRKIAVSVAALALLAVPAALVHAAETADIWSKDGQSGASYSRSTQCAAAYAVASQLQEKGSDPYKLAMLHGAAWRRWASDVAEGRDANSEINTRMYAFGERTSAMSDDAYMVEVANELKACTTIKDMMIGADMQPFASIYNDVLSGNGLPPEALPSSYSNSATSRPDIDTAMDCVAVNDFAVSIVGKDSPDSQPYYAAYQGWSGYVRSIFSGNEGQMETAYKARADSLGAYYDGMEAQQEGTGYDQLSADVDTCTSLSGPISEFF